MHQLNDKHTFKKPWRGRKDLKSFHSHKFKHLKEKNRISKRNCYYNFFSLVSFDASLSCLITTHVTYIEVEIANVYKGCGKFSSSLPYKKT